MKTVKNKNDIICAAATPPGRSALAIVRISGPGSIELVSKSVSALTRVSSNDDRRLLYGFIADKDSNPIDEVTIIPYFAPKSYTAEEMVEIICHGGYMSSKMILERLISCGARFAEPGEFTKRAFINGRISLSQAEAIAAAIDAKSELALKAAARNLKGELFHKIDDIKNKISGLLTLIEAEIDFSEEEIDKTPLDKIKIVIEKQLDESSRILQSYDFGRGLNRGYRVAIVGKSNVGKSSLLNALLNRDRAIVTEIPGTTRDTLTEWIEIDGFPILLTDTAGLRKSGDVVERIGQDRTADEIANSDLVLFMIDGSEGVTEEDENVFRAVGDKRTIMIVNKIDLGEKENLDPSGLLPNKDIVKISALRGAGLDELKRAIAHIFHIDDFSLDMAMLATQRQHDAMSKACESLARAVEEIKAGQSCGSVGSGEVIAVFIRETLDHLGELVGETTSEDILNSIFERFCIGK